MALVKNSADWTRELDSRTGTKQETAIIHSSFHYKKPFFSLRYS